MQLYTMWVVNLVQKRIKTLKYFFRHFTQISEYYRTTMKHNKDEHFIVFRII